MALNKYMHPRNIYKNAPDFANLAKSFQEFSSIVNVDVTGKVSIDFKDPHSLRVLTKYLLKSDFDLDIVIPEDRLVPTLPLRLNYVLWVEDLLNSVERKENIRGLDIGTGACAIYPLLAAVKNKWHMVGTETDKESLQIAQENVKRNNLEDLIEVKSNSTSSILEHVLAVETMKSFDFSMCNPPFYSNVQELCESRSPARLPPKNGFTGSPQELITDGGELAFCRTMIKESKDHKDKVLLFTTMVGHKYNLKELSLDLKAEDINHTSTEFCQGRVTRWGLAWTFQDYDLSKLVPARDRPRKKTPPIVYVLPDLKDIPYDVETITKRIKSILDNLKATYKVLNKRGNNISMDVKAWTNTWSNQRRKRRMMRKLDIDDAKKTKIDDLPVDGNSSCNTEQNIDKSKNTVDIKLEEINNSHSSHNCRSDEVHDSNNSINDERINSESSSKIAHDNSNVFDKCGDGSKILEYNKSESSSPLPHKTSEINSQNIFAEVNMSDDREPVIHAFLRVFKKDVNILLEMEFLDGSSGKEGLHQIVQYIKNNWK